MSNILIQKDGWFILIWINKWEKGDWYKHQPNNMEERKMNLIRLVKNKWKHTKF